MNDTDADKTSSQPLVPSPTSVSPSERGKLRLIVAASVLLALSCIAVVGLAGRYFSESSMKHISNGGFTYSFMFSNASYVRKIDGVSYLYGYSKASIENTVVVAKPTTDLFLGSCHVLGSGYQLAFMTARGAYPSYAVCDNSHKIYAALVTKVAGSHIVELFSQNEKEPISLSMAESIFDSLTITGK